MRRVGDNLPWCYNKPLHRFHCNKCATAIYVSALVVTFFSIFA
nr:MAG TPA: hypothetical protein [Caudoviricetes sp.]